MYVKINFDIFIDIIIIGLFLMEEYAIIFFIDDWLFAKTGLKIIDVIIGIVINFNFSICAEMIVGIIFCHVIIIKQFHQDEALISEGIQRWNGIIPILINILVIIITLSLMGQSIIKLIKMDIKNMEDAILWIIRYFIDWSLIFFDFVSSGKNLIKLISIDIHDIKILLLDIVKIVDRNITIMNIVFDELIIIKKRFKS